MKALLAGDQPFIGKCGYQQTATQRSQNSQNVAAGPVQIPKSVRLQAPAGTLQKVRDCVLRLQLTVLKSDYPTQTVNTPDPDKPLALRTCSIKGKELVKDTHTHCDGEYVRRRNNLSH
jgi:hypothetical protein